jgi:hypothetical protein
MTRNFVILEVMKKLKGEPDALTTLRMNPEVYKRVRHLAVEQETTVKALVTRALVELLRREEGRGGRRVG